jgi:hypothetical protein
MCCLIDFIGCDLLRPTEPSHICQLILLSLGADMCKVDIDNIMWAGTACMMESALLPIIRDLVLNNMSWKDDVAKEGIVR